MSTALKYIWFLFHLLPDFYYFLSPPYLINVLQSNWNFIFSSVQFEVTNNRSVSPSIFIFSAFHFYLRKDFKGSRVCLYQRQGIVHYVQANSHQWSFEPTFFLLWTFWRKTAVIYHSGNDISSCYAQHSHFLFPFIIFSEGLWVSSKHPRILEFWRCSKLNTAYFERIQCIVKALWRVGR